MGILSFAVLKIAMNERKSIEEFLWDIDCDLLQYEKKKTGREKKTKLCEFYHFVS